MDLTSKLTEFERKVYAFIKAQGDVQVSNIPKRMWGAIPNLKSAGLVKSYRRPTTPWASKKQTFVKTLEK